MNCAVGKKVCSANSRSCSCFTFDDVISFVKTYNKNITKKKKSCQMCIKIKHENPDKLFYYLDILKKKVCKGKCSDLEFIKKMCSDSSGEKDKKKCSQVIKQNFKPVGPLGREWLSNFDINKVLEQYENHYPGFLYIETTPIDFDIDEFYDIYRKSFRNDYGISKIATVYNTDPSYKRGEHWISSFIDLKKKHIYFYDSNGHKPPREITQLLKCVNKNLFNEKHPILWNDYRHQNKDSECGVFCLNFITTLLDKRLTFKEFCNQPILNDDYVFQKRRDFFRR